MWWFADLLNIVARSALPSHSKSRALRKCLTFRPRQFVRFDPFRNYVPRLGHVMPPVFMRWTYLSGICGSWTANAFIVRAIRRPDLPQCLADTTMQKKFRFFLWPISSDLEREFVRSSCRRAWSRKCGSIDDLQRTTWRQQQTQR